MKPQANVFDVQSTVKGEKIAMGVKASAMNHIMDMLAGLYSNNVRAVIREYSTNARDAQIEAGVTRPIEVTLPTQLSQFFKVQDFGVGMDEDTIRTVYSQYGESTKRLSNDFNGTLGVGCKSALAYQPQFIVSSIKAGHRIEVAIGRDSNGAGYMLVQTQYATTDADGTTVTVPVERNDIQRFATEAADVFKVWPEGSVLVNGEAPARFDGLKVADGLFIHDRGAQSFLVMGNVAYPCPELNDLVPNGKVYAFVPNGDIEFAPSREALKYTDITRKQIDRIKARFRKAITTSAQREIDAQSTVHAAIEKMLHWDRYVPSSNGDYTYRGTPLARTLNAVPFNPPRFTKPSYAGGHSYQIDSTFLCTDRASTQLMRGFNDRGLKQLDLKTVARGIFVTGFAPEKFVLDHQRKLRRWADEQGIDPSFNRFVVCREAAPVSPWIAHTVDWETIKKIRLDPKDAVTSGRIPGSYDLYTEDTVFGPGYNGRISNCYGKSGIEGALIRPSIPLFHVHGNLYESHRYAAVLKELMPAFTLVCLPENRIPKWEREVPRSVKVQKHIVTLLTQWKKSLTADELVAVALSDSGNLRHYPRMDANKVKDPALKNAIRVAKITNVNDMIQRVVGKRNRFSGLVLASHLTLDGSDPLEKYLLFDWRTFLDAESHVYNYINAAHAAA